MRICTYESHHFDGLDHVWRACFPNNSSRNQAGYSVPAKLAMGDDLLLVAEDSSGDGSVVGTIMAGYDGHRGWLYSVAVLPEHRHQGIGELLVTEACERLRKLGCVKVNLQIVADNHAVQAFYERLGFTVEPRISMGRKL